MMGKFHKRFWTAFLALCCTLAFSQRSLAQADAQPQKTGKLTVKVNGIRDTEGNVRVALRSNENTVVASQIVDIDPKTLTAEAVFDNLAAGNYGVAVIHDENKNGKLDFNDFGMPLEGYGHSNDPAKRQGPPDFNETKFAFVGPSTTITVNLIYWP